MVWSRWAGIKVLIQINLIVCIKMCQFLMSWCHLSKKMCSKLILLYKLIKKNNIKGGWAWWLAQVYKSCTLEELGDEDKNRERFQSQSRRLQWLCWSLLKPNRVVYACYAFMCPIWDPKECVSYVCYGFTSQILDPIEECVWLRLYGLHWGQNRLHCRWSIKARRRYWCLESGANAHQGN